MIKDSESKEQLIDAALKLINEPKTMESLSKNILKMALHDSAKHIADEVLKLVDQKQ